MAGWFENARLTWQHGRTGRYDLVWDAIRVPVAFLVAPLGAPLVMALLYTPGHTNPSLYIKEPLILLYMSLSLSIACLVTWSVGVLLFLIMRKLKLTEFWVAPCVAGILPVIVIAVLMEPPPASVIVLVSLPGAAVGAIFWLIARPDRARQSASHAP